VILTFSAVVVVCGKMAEQLDSTDRKILNMLQKDARVAFSQIASEVGVSEATVRYRVKNLEKEKVIKSYTTLLDPVKAGFSTTGIMMVKLDAALFEAAAKQISELPETYHVFQNTGDFDIVSVVHTRDLAHLSDLRKRVQMIAGVREVTVSAATRLIKIKTSFDL
jgi:Lrp/AsnC family transcriptional regulator for asnA, asnC and gidA